MKDDGTKKNSDWSCTGLIILMIISYFVLKGIIGWIGNTGKYEGMSAREWADEYNALSDCVERGLQDPSQTRDSISANCF